MENNTFKASLFGGFKREDVIDYITKASAESSSRIEALEGDVDKLCSQERELRDQLAALRGENAKLSQALANAVQERDDARRAHETATAELASLRVEAEALRRETASLRAENDELRPLSEQYSAVKAHIAGIELDARQRADAFELSTRERLNAMIDECRAHCDSVLASLNDTCLNVTGELRRAENSVSSLPAAFSSLRAGLDALEQPDKKPTEAKN